MKCAHDFDLRLGRDLIFQAGRPITCIHQEPAKAFALGDRHHGIILRPGHRFVRRLHPRQDLTQNQRLAALRQRQADAVHVRRTPDIAVFDATKN